MKPENQFALSAKLSDIKARLGELREDEISESKAAAREYDNKNGTRFSRKYHYVARKPELFWIDAKDERSFEPEEWDGTMKQLKAFVERAKAAGAKEVYIDQRIDCHDSFYEYMQDQFNGEPIGCASIQILFD